MTKLETHILHYTALTCNTLGHGNHGNSVAVYSGLGQHTVFLPSTQPPVGAALRIARHVI